MRYTLIFCVFLNISSFLFIPTVNAADLTDSVVKIFTTTNPMDYYRPWQSRGVGASGGSGVIISDTEVLTNAHVVSDQTFIQVKRNGDSRKYTARLKAIGHDCDLALLTIDDSEFFKDTKPIPFGDLPKLQDAVIVLGYPKGGEKLSITEGVVSRVEVSTYSQSARKLLTVQIDAAINAGNSGGPVIQNGKLVGIAMQSFRSGENIGYMIPTPIINHFFKDLTDGRYHGFPIVGINYTNTENAHLRRYFKIDEKEGGVLITRILPFSPAANVLKGGDVILAIDGVPIGEDGTFAFRRKERLSLPHLISKKQIGESVEVLIVRKGKEEKVSIPITEFTPLVPNPRHFEKPPYYIHGGLVFTVLSTDLLKSWGSNWWEKSPVDLKYYLMGKGRLNEEGKSEVVVLLRVLSDEINIGYHGHGNEVIAGVNGETFHSFREFVVLLNKVKEEEYTILETLQDAKIILSNENIESINNKIMKRNHIPYPYSNDVKSWISQ